ncbi:1669_t:CDS:2 [Ambispora gerdemannii]|uniref:1669_t:CDS:1 n=1 Tax=Ambispora gerdemannii TaxID=144530 RepID=A0A9N8Z2M7_9GLOM|nr:1669_t:CDS:2 [Ambispora gerdemannii]
MIVLENRRNQLEIVTAIIVMVIVMDNVLTEKNKMHTENSFYSPRNQGSKLALL